MKKKIWLLGVVVLVLAIAVAAFAAHNATENGTPGKPGVVQDQEISAEQEKTEPETTEGVFVGLADNHTVEIEVAGVPRAFALGEGVATLALQEGDSVSFQYKEDENGRLVISHLVKLEAKGNENGKDKQNAVEETNKEKEVHRAEGILTGRIDNHSVEIEVGGQPKAFALSEALQEKDFARGEIRFQYYVDINGRSIITEADFQEPRQTEVHTAEGNFMGLADNHTAEIVINGEPKSFALDEDISFAGFAEGEKIFIAFQENEQGRQEIIKVEKIF